MLNHIVAIWRAARERWASLDLHQREAIHGWGWVIALLLAIVVVFAILWKPRA